MPKIVRTAEEVERVLAVAQKLTFAAEDKGTADDVAAFAYKFARWLLGDEDIDLAEALIEGTELDDEESLL